MHAQVYDVSKFYDHPGGRVVFNFAGQDASDVFAVFHPGSAHELLRERFVGELAEEKGAAEPTRQQQFEREVRRLRAEFVKEKLFESRCAPTQSSPRSAEELARAERGARARAKGARVEQGGARGRMRRGRERVGWGGGGGKGGGEAKERSVG